MDQISHLNSDLSSAQKDNTSLHQQIAKLKRELQLARQKVDDIHQNAVVLRTAKVTDLDEAKWRRSSESDITLKENIEPPTSKAAPIEKGNEKGWDFSEPGAVSRLMSILEGQVSLLDQELE